MRRPLHLHRGNVNGSRVTSRTRRTLHIIKLSPTIFTTQCPVSLSNKRTRHITVTHTVISSPNVVLTSRPVDTVSITTHIEVLRTFHTVHTTGPDVSLIVISRSLNIIRRVTSHITILRSKHIRRDNAAARVLGRPYSTCAHSLVRTTSVRT